MHRQREILWAPWRVQYIEAPKKDDCFFCKIASERRDTVNLVLCRRNASFAVMNKFPYNNGHAMVAPYRHVAGIESLTDDEITDTLKTAGKLVQAAKKALGAEGFNVGANLGKVAGAGVEAHFHLHVVPRWNGDTNFMPVVAATKVMPEHLSATYKKLHKALADV